MPQSTSTKTAALLLAFEMKSDNGHIPPIKTCLDLIKNTAAGFTKPTPKQCSVFGRELVGSVPYLERSGIDLPIFLKSLVIIFSAHSIAAAKHILDPVNGVIGTEEFINLAKINLALKRFEAQQHELMAAAEWAMAENERRERQTEQTQINAAERLNFADRHGKSPTEFAREALET